MHKKQYFDKITANRQRHTNISYYWQLVPIAYFWAQARALSCIWPGDYNLVSLDSQIDMYFSTSEM